MELAFPFEVGAARHLALRGFPRHQARFVFAYRDGGAPPLYVVAVLHAQDNPYAADVVLAEAQALLRNGKATELPRREAPARQEILLR